MVAFGAVMVLMFGLAMLAYMVVLTSIFILKARERHHRHEAQLRHQHIQQHDAVSSSSPVQAPESVST